MKKIPIMDSVFLKLKACRVSVAVHLAGCHSVSLKLVFMTIKELRKVQRKVFIYNNTFKYYYSK